MKTKVKVSKKAVGVFVVSLTILLLLVFVTAPASKANTSTQCVLTPVQSIATGMDTPTDTPMEPVPFPNVTGMPWDVFTPTTGGGASPPIVTPVTPAVVSGGGMPWDIFTGPTHIPHLPISSPIPQGQWSPFVTPQHGGPVHLPSPVACGIMGEESALSANITIPVLASEDESALSANTTVVYEEHWDERKRGRYEKHIQGLYELWNLLRDDGNIIRKTATLLKTVDDGPRILGRDVPDGDGLLHQLMQHFYKERARVDAVFQATGGNHRFDDYNSLSHYLINFDWLSPEADELNLLGIDIGPGNLLALRDRLW